MQLQHLRLCPVRTSSSRTAKDVRCRCVFHRGGKLTIAPSPSSITIANGLLPYVVDQHRTKAIEILATYRCLSQCHELRLASFSSSVPDTARLDFILIVAAFFVIASLQVLVFLNEIRDKCLSLPIRLAESLEALKVACGRRVAIVAVHRYQIYRSAFSSSSDAVCDVGQAFFQQTLDGRKSKSRGGRI